MSNLDPRSSFVSSPNPSQVLWNRAVRWLRDLFTPSREWRLAVLKGDGYDLGWFYWNDRFLSDGGILQDLRDARTYLNQCKSAQPDTEEGQAYASGIDEFLKELDDVQNRF